jgi:hypothetical protein
MCGKELTEEEIQKYTLTDPNNNIINSYKNNKDLLQAHSHVKVDYILGHDISEAYILAYTCIYQYKTFLKKYA